MARTGDEEPSHIGSPLDPVRAAVQMVADGSACRVTVVTPFGARILPAARQLAQAAGVTLEAVDPPSAEDPVADPVMSTGARRPAA